MANVSLKTDFKDGEKLFGQQLNNNFAVIKAALEAMNKIVWQDDPDDSVTAFRGTTEEINQRDIIDGQLLYDTTTGETYIDVGSQRISTGSGNSIHIGSGTPTNPATQIWIDPNEPLQLIGTEVTNSMEGTESNKAPSVQAIKNYIDNIYSTDEIKTNKVWIDNKPIYRKVIVLESGTIHAGYYEYKHNISNLDKTLNIYGMCYRSTRQHPIQRVVPDEITKWGIGLGDITQSKFALHFGTGYQDINLVYIVIEYTKTNDSVGGE